MGRRETARLRAAGWVVLEYGPMVRIVDALGTLQMWLAGRFQVQAKLPLVNNRSLRKSHFS